MYILYDYFRSSASYRVRIALNYKELAFEIRPVHLVQDGGQQHVSSYEKINPQHLVPSFIDTAAGVNQDQQISLTQSLAIIEYLEKKHSTPSLFFADKVTDAQARSLAYVICCDIHPLDNLRVLKYLKGELNISDDEKLQWYRHWIQQGFTAFEKKLVDLQCFGCCCFGDKISIADICLIPQVYNAYRFECDMSKYPLITTIYNYCLQLDCFSRSAPEIVLEKTPS